MNSSKYGYSLRQVALMKQLNKLWEQHVHWTRSFIISTANNLGDLDAVTYRLLRNPDDFANLLRPFFGNGLANTFKNLLTQHLLIAADLVNAAKEKNSAAAQQAHKRWYSNACEIAEFMSRISPYWSEAKWKSLLSSHLQMIEQQAALILGNNYIEDVNMYDEVENQALEMADYMFSGIIKQFAI